MRYKKIKAMAIGMSLTMLLLSACGANTEEIAEVMADTADVEIEAESEMEVPDTVEDVGEEEGKEEETEPEEIEEEPLAMVPYFEENELEFCKNMVVETKAVVTNINDESDMMEMDALWELKNITIESDEENRKQIITIESECTSYYWTDRKNRQMYSIMLPAARYCDLNTGQCFPSAVEIGDIELGYETDVEWNDVIFELDCTGKTEWEDDKGCWDSDGEGGFIHETTVHYADTIVVTPEGYDSMGIILSPFIIEWMDNLTVGVSEESTLIKDVLEEEKGSYLFSVRDVYEMLNKDNSNSGSEGDKDSAVTNTENSKESTTSNSNDSQDNTTPKQEEKKEQQNSHTHNYTGSITKNPTCSEAGVKTYTCSSCGSSYSEEIAKTDHQWVSVTESVYHPSTGHYEVVTKKEAWCGCGASGFQSQAELNEHWANDNCGGTTCGITEKSENVWITDQSEYYSDEVTGYQCSVCGAMQ